MKKLVKFLFLTITALIFVVIGAILFLDPNDFKGQITEQFEKATGRSMTISGNIGRTLWPNIGFSISGVSIGNAKGYTDPSFAEVENLSLGLAIIPLFSKKVEVKAIQLAGVQINAEKNKDGVGNWVMASSATEQVKPEDSSQPAEIPALSLDGVTLERVNLKYVDHRAGQTIAIRDMSAHVGAFSFGKPFDVQLTLSADNDAPQSNVTLNLQGKVTADPNTQTYLVDGLQLVVDASGKAVGPKPLSLKLDSNLALNLKSQVASLKDLSLQVGDLALTGTIEATQLLGDPQASADLKSNTFNLKQTLEALGLPPLQTRLDTALTKLSTAIKLTYARNSVNISDLNLQLDDTTLTGTAKVINFAKPAIAFDLSMTDINVDSYLPPASPNTTPEATVPATRRSDNTDLPLAGLKLLDIDGKLKISKVLANNLTLADLSLSVLAKSGHVQITEKIGSLYQGSQSADISIDARQASAKYRIKKNLSNVQIGELLKDFGKPDIIEGTSNITVDLFAQGNNAASIKRSLNGSTGFTFSNGVLKYLDVVGSLNVSPEVSAFVSKETGFDLAGVSGQTDFTELKGNGLFKNGIMTMNDLSLASPVLSVKGQGTVNLPDETLDYKLAVSQVNVTTAADGQKSYQPKGRTINLALTGPLSDPHKSVDLTSMLKEEQLNKVNEQVDKKLETLGIPKETGDQLKKLLPF